jgi:diguanylate cyclase (GGDEF)-like protein
MLVAHENDELQLSIAMLDLDHFKNINDEQGHLTGDRVLQDLTQLLKALLREGDVLARYGGEEFVILMPHTPLRSACSLAQRARARIEEKLPTTISIGVAATMPTESATNVISRADAALYTAKREGRNCVCLHEGANGKIVTLRDGPPPLPSTCPAQPRRPYPSSTALPSRALASYNHPCGAPLVFPHPGVGPWIENRDSRTSWQQR